MNVFCYFFFVYKNLAMNVKKEEEEIVVAYLQTCKELMD
jgi:hypothetical protein